MNPKIKEIAEEAGFCFWGNEDWKPHGAIIDWSADYDREFQKYTELLIRECLDQVDEFGRLSKAFLEEGIDPEIDVTKEVLSNFGIEK